MGGYGQKWDHIYIDHKTIKSGVSHKWFDELSRLIEWFVDADSDGRNNFWFECQSTLHV